MADSDSARVGGTPSLDASTLNQMLSAQAKVWKAEQAKLAAERGEDPPG